MINSFQENEQNRFDIQGNWEFDIWPTDPKIKRDLQLVKPNPLVKYENCVGKFSSKWAETFFDIQGHDKVTPKSKRGFFKYLY